MVNSRFGKTLQSNDKYNKSILVHNQEGFLKQTIGKTIMDFNVLSHGNEYNDGLVEVKLQKDKYLIKCAKYIGSAILSYSKILMLDFVYNCLYRSYNEKEATLLYTDTDSCI